MIVKCDSTGLNFLHEQKERLSISADIPSPLYSTETVNTKHRQGLRTQNVSSESLESLQRDEEVIGIITMEDVMEELLQVTKLVNKLMNCFFYFLWQYTFEN